jgi:hypothetical protein
MATILADDLRDRHIVDLSTSICEEIVINLIKKTAEHANTRTMTADEAADISKRST